MQLHSNTLQIHSKEKLKWLTFPHFDATGKTKHCFTTKHGGVSHGIYQSLNLGFSRGDEEENVRENYQIICKAIEVDENDLVFSQQVHKDQIYHVTSQDMGKGYRLDSDIKEIDGLITNEKGIPLITFYADCVPLFFLDQVKEVVALAHAGWRGTVQKIGAKMVTVMQESYGSDMKDILIGIGPSIGSCCFEVGEEVVNEFKKAFPDEEKYLIMPRQNGKYMIDLWSANKLTLIKEGILEDNILITDLCTKCHLDHFYSHRGHHGMRGSLAAIIQLK
ncbi:peptidoglycan editing factor PgeF [Vallitalea okinawensis]|uniref:peptidoglycan editing factor PgeF n=1 Tax=Vallitalea okinawensis TaxID=2078660 RepID=UPI000CFC7302|nr:peptidoglycan editing factor PgeF [Vallitalea okinawensis]